MKEPSPGSRALRTWGTSWVTRTLTSSSVSPQHPHPSFTKVKLGTAERGQSQPTLKAGWEHAEPQLTACVPLLRLSLPQRLHRNQARCQIVIPLQNLSWSCLTSSIPAKPLPALLPSETINHCNNPPRKARSQTILKKPATCREMRVYISQNEMMSYPESREGLHPESGHRKNCCEMQLFLMEETKIFILGFYETGFYKFRVSWIAMFSSRISGFSNRNSEFFNYL